MPVRWPPKSSADVWILSPFRPSCVAASGLRGDVWGPNWLQSPRVRWSSSADDDDSRASFLHLMRSNALIGRVPKPCKVASKLPQPGALHWRPNIWSSDRISKFLLFLSDGLPSFCDLSSQYRCLKFFTGKLALPFNSYQAQMPSTIT